MKKCYHFILQVKNQTDFFIDRFFNAMIKKKENTRIFVLVILPWLDTSKVRSAIFRPLYKQFYWFLVADVLILGYVGAMPAEGLYLLVARIATAYYFLHFLVILPVLGLKEKTLEVPLSLTEPVLGGSPNEAMARNKKELS